MSAQEETKSLEVRSPNLIHMTTLRYPDLVVFLDTEGQGSKSQEKKTYGQWLHSLSIDFTNRFWVVR